MKRIGVVLLCLSFSLWSQDAKPESLSAADERLAASLLATLTDNEFAKRIEAQAELSKLVFSDPKKAPAWDNWLEESKKKTLDTEVLSRLPFNVAFRTNLCGQYKGIIDWSIRGWEIHIIPDGSYKLFASDKELIGQGTYTIERDGSATLRGTFGQSNPAAEEELKCTATMLDDRLVTRTKSKDNTEIVATWMRITTGPPSDVELRHTIHECGQIDNMLRNFAWGTINRLPMKTRAELLLTHLTDTDVPISPDYLLNLTMWSATEYRRLILEIRRRGGSISLKGVPINYHDRGGNSRQQVYLHLLAGAITAKTGEVFLRSFITLFEEYPKLQISDTMKKKFAEPIDSMSYDMGNFVFTAKIDWKALSSDALSRAMESFMNRPSPDKQSKDSARRDKSEALKRYYELNPVKARQIILEQLRKDDPDFDYSALSLLPDKELPDLTADFRKIVSAKDGNSWITLPCIERYGAAELLPDVIAWYEPLQGRWACALQDAALGFIMKHDREAGFKYLKEAMTHRTETHCYARAVLYVLRGDQGEDAKAFLVGVLADAEDEVVQNAAQLLIEFPDGANILKKKLADKEHGVSKKVSEYFENLIKHQESYPILIKENASNPKD